MDINELSTQLPHDGACSSIAVINPFNGAEVGAVPNIPPEDAQAILRIAREGARACRREGVRFAYEEMTQPKVVCIRRAACQV